MADADIRYSGLGISTIKEEDAEVATNVSKLNFTGAITAEVDATDPTQVNIDVVAVDAASGGAPTVNVLSDASSVLAGTADTFLRSDARLIATTAAPVTISTANSQGNASTLARSNHVHAHGDLAGGTLHANATTGTAGFMSAADKTAVDALGTKNGASGYAGLNSSTKIESTLLTFGTTAGTICEGNDARLSGGSTPAMADILVQEHFVSSAVGSPLQSSRLWSSFASTGTVSTGPSVAGHPGVIMLNVVSATNYISIYVGDTTNGTFFITSNALTFDSVVRWKTRVDAGSMQMGLCNTPWNSSIGNLAQIMFTRNNGSGSANIFGQVRSDGGGLVGSVDLGVAPAVDAWVRLGFVASTSGVQFYVAGVATGSAVVSNGGNDIPTMGLTLGAKFTQTSAPAGAAAYQIDYINVSQVTAKS